MAEIENIDVEKTEEENEVTEVTYAKAGPSLGFALGFLVVYVIIVFAVLGIFFKIPF
ncbi:MAG: hypothetical protein L0Y79_10700 [Chlorobi bacterium]|nr:hypothetical protein [Chlorobiota bacterium]MCI0715294.1 hypothetical protein [Chlorobiota bacterium]